MNCPNCQCQHARTAIIGQRQTPERTERKRKCLRCGCKFTTLEVQNLGIDLLLRSIEANRIASEAREIMQRSNRQAEQLAALAKQLTPEG